MCEIRKQLELMREIIFESNKKGLLEKRDSYNLTFIQRSIIRYLADKPKLTMSDLGKMMHINKSAMTRIVDSLEKNKIAVREIMGGNSRGYCIKLTKKGEHLADNINKVPLQLLGNIFSICNDKEKEMILETTGLFLRKLKEAKDVVL